METPTILDEIQKESDIQRPLILHLYSDFSNRFDWPYCIPYRQYKSRRM